MSRRCSELAGRTAAALFFAVLVAGCATGTGGAPVVGEAADRRTQGPSARVEVEADVGFTVTEVAVVPSQSRADHRRALVLLAAGDLPPAIDLLEAVVASVPEATAPLVDLGIALRRAERYEEAVARLEQALALTPRHPVAHNELGLAQRARGRFGAARLSYQRALEVYPGFHAARLNLGILCDLYLDDLPCALAEYERYRQSDPEHDRVDVWIGDVRNRLGGEAAP